jgi:hypothetical protein
MAKAKADKAPELPTIDTLEIIEEKAIVNIKMSTSFFQRLQMLYMSMIKNKSSEEVQKFLEETKTQSITSEENYHIETLLILLSEFQKNAKAEGQTKIVTQDELKKLTEERQAELEKANQK